LSGVHEIYGHGIMKWNSPDVHHKAYWAVMESKYWEATTLSFKHHNVKAMWRYYSQYHNNTPMPKHIDQIFRKYYK
jgi:hypothetical protein